MSPKRKFSLLRYRFKMSAKFARDTMEASTESFVIDTNGGDVSGDESDSTYKFCCVEASESTDKFWDSDESNSTVNFCSNKIELDECNDELDTINDESGSESDESIAIKNEDTYDLSNLPDILEPVDAKAIKSKITKNFSLEDTYLVTNYTKNKNENSIMSNCDQLLKKSFVLSPGFEKQLSLPAIQTQRSLKLERKKLRARTKGTKWFNIPATEVTPEVKNDFQVLKMRGVIDNKHFYKKNNFTNWPKYFQIGQVVEGPADFYNGRIVKSQRKKTMVEELLADAECKKFQKKKFKQITDSQRWKRTKKENRKEKGKKKGQKKNLRNKY